jgi:hypothetical protein
MSWKTPLLLLTLACATTGCATYPDVGSIKFIGFSDEINKGKPAGQIESDDCVYRVFGYPLGTEPDISSAIANARTGKKSQLSDVVAQSDSTAKVRYVDNVTAQRGGFNAYVFGKSCIEVKGAGYL